jgi:hypothetical protein
MKLRMIFRMAFLSLIISVGVAIGVSTNANAFHGFGGMNMDSVEDENDDSVVKFGDFKTKSKIKESQSRTLDPIQENSFAADVNSAINRGPASVGVSASDDANRSPSGAIPPKAMVRNLNQKKAVQEVAVIVNDLGFFPSTIFVTQGIPVRLFVTGASKKSQCFMMDSYGVRRQIQSQRVEEITFTPDESGSFAFSCPMNGAKGVMFVKELDMGRMPANVKVETTAGAE